MARSKVQQYVRVCQCGCNLPTTIAPHTDATRGWMKGQPLSYACGHNGRVRGGTPDPYARTARGTGGVFHVHRIRAEKALGHPLPPGAEIHHPDRDQSNPNARLVICESRAYHLLLHSRMRVKAAGGNPNTQAICGRCHQVKLLNEFWDYSRISYCRACKPEYDREWRRRKLDKMS